MVNKFQKIALPILATCALIPFHPLQAQTGPPPVQVGKAYSTEFAMNTMTFTALKNHNNNWVQVRIHEGHRAEKELGDVVWLNLSMLKVIAEAKTEDAGNPKDENAAGAPLARDSIVGKWQHSTGKNWEFFSDGTLIMSEKDKDLTLHGKWRRMDDGRVKMEFIMLGSAIAEVYTEEIKGEETSFTDSKGKENLLKRVK